MLHLKRPHSTTLVALHYCRANLRKFNWKRPVISQLSDNLLEEAAKASLIRRVFAIQNDILGIYDPKPDSLSRQGGRIELYWVAIGIAAQMLRVDISDLATVTLIHELAHGYTHWGRDADDQYWDTEWMTKEVDRAVVEGLAQYYTDIIAEYLGDSRRPAIHYAYLRLRRLQRGWYRIHDRWVNKYSPEVVRYALVEFRRSKCRSLQQFEEILSQRQTTLRATPRPLHPRVKEDVGLYGPILEEAIDELGINEGTDELRFCRATEVICEFAALYDLDIEAGIYTAITEWSLAFSQNFDRAIEKLDKATRARILDAMRYIASKPTEPHGDTLKPLTGDYEGLWRYRIGDYRLLYQVDKLKKRIVLLDFKPRGSAYVD